MACAFVEFGFVFFQAQDLPGAEAVRQHVPGVEVLNGRRPAGLVVQLLRRVAVQQEQPAGFQGAFDAVEDLRPELRRRELDEDRRDDIVFRGCPLQVFRSASRKST